MTPRRLTRPGAGMGRALGAVACLLLVAGLALASETGAVAEQGSPWLDFFWKALNFGVLVGLLIYLLRSPVSRFLSRSATDERERFEATRLAAMEADAELARQKQRIDRLQAELEAMHAQARQDADHEREALLEQARDQADRLEAQTRVQVEQELRKAQLELRRQLAEESIRLAQRMVGGRMQSAERRRAVEDYIEQLEPPS